AKSASSATPISASQRVERIRAGSSSSARSIVSNRLAMRVVLRIVTNFAIAAVVGGALVAGAAAQTPVRVIVRTELGDIVLEVDTKRAPNTAANFLRYVD